MPPTHRVELLPAGGFVVNINDRCVIVLYIMIMPACRIGRISPRGDLLPA
jgi:hypothetical protein